MSEYEACIARLQTAKDIGIKELEVYGDSSIVMYQASGLWFIKEPRFHPYHACLERLAQNFDHITFHYLPRIRNQFADALATLAFMIEIPKGVGIHPVEIEHKSEQPYCMEIEASSAEVEPWYFDIKQYVESQTFLLEATKNERQIIQHLAT